MSCTSPNTVASTTLPFADAFLALEELLEVRDGLLHHLGRLQHERQDQLARAELVADLFHRRQQHVVQHVDRVALRAAPRRSSPRCRPCAGAGSRCGCAPRPARPASSSTCAAPAARRRACASQCSMTRCSASGRRLSTRSSHSSRSSGADLGVRRDVLGVDDRHVEPGFDAVVEHDRVEGGARGRLEAERHVRDAERRQHAGQLALDQPNALDRLDRRVDELGVAGREREGERVEDQRARRQPVLADHDVVDAPRDLELALAPSSPCPVSSIVSATTRRAGFLHERHHRVDLRRGRSRD